MKKIILPLVLAALMVSGCVGNTWDNSSSQKEPEYTISEEYYNSYYRSMEYVNRNANFTMEALVITMEQQADIVFKVDNGEYELDIPELQVHQYVKLGSKASSTHYSMTIYSVERDGDIDVDDEELPLAFIPFGVGCFVPPRFRDLTYNEEDHSYHTYGSVSISDILEEDVEVSGKVFFEDNVLVRSEFTFYGEEMEDTFTTGGIYTNYGNTKVELPL